MTPTPFPIAALARLEPAKANVTEPVAIIAMDAESFLVVDREGTTYQADQGLVSIVDYRVQGVVDEAFGWDGS